jgi:hypothetical protein
VAHRARPALFVLMIFAVAHIVMALRLAPRVVNSRSAAEHHFYYFTRSHGMRRWWIRYRWRFRSRRCSGCRRAAAATHHV